MHCQFDGYYEGVGETLKEHYQDKRKLLALWVESIYDKCQIKDVPFFFKQWGNTNAYRERLTRYIERCKEFSYQADNRISI